MASIIIGLDFGTSQTKVCLFNKTNGIREFLKFGNNKYFLPSLIVRKNDNTFSYGDENVPGTKYRYFKMSAAEDSDLIQVTNEDLGGRLRIGTIDDYRKYSTDCKIKPEILVVLYLTFIYLYVKEKKSSQHALSVGGLLGRLAGNNKDSENTYSINLGIPTEWNNPDHIRRKIKFQSLLLNAVELSKQFDNLEKFLLEAEESLLERISEINKNCLHRLGNNNTIESSELIKTWLKEQKLSVFQESAAGINYLLQTKRLANGAYATLDIGAGTTDIAIFEVNNNTLSRYYCSESVAIAANDFYREYAKLYFKKKIQSFEEIKEIENRISNKIEIDDNFIYKSTIAVRGYCNYKGIEFAIRKTFYRKYYINLFKVNQVKATGSKNHLNQKPIIVFGGGANLHGFSKGLYCFFQESNPQGSYDCSFSAKPITDYINNVEISDENDEIKNYINLLVLALGLTYGEQNGEYIPFNIPAVDSEVHNTIENIDRYFYYDLQAAVYK